MFWRSVVGKLVITILLLVSFVLFILTVLLLQFFEDFHIQEAEKNMMQSASEIGLLLEDHDDKASIMEITEAIKDKRSEEHTSELQSRGHLVCRLLLEKNI